MTITPNTSELYSAQIPALATLVSLGWDYLSPADCLAMRGGNHGVLLTGVLVDELKQRRFEFKGRSHPLSPNAIDQIVRELASPAMHEGLLTANEGLYNALTLGVFLFLTPPLLLFIIQNGLIIGHRNISAAIAQDFHGNL